MKKETIRDCFSLLEADYGEQSSQKKELWAKMFKDYTDEQLINAVGEYLNKGKFFPRISDIKELLEGSTGDEAELAWLVFKEKLEKEGVYRTVTFPKYPAIGATIEAMGGWIKICDMKIDEEKWIKKEFVKLYPLMKRKGNYPKKLIGLTELENGNKYSEKEMSERYRRRLDGKRINRKLIQEVK